MSPAKQTLWWGSIFIFTLGLLYILSPILLPFVAGMAIAYIFDPLCDWLEKKGASRLIATILITTIIGLLFIGVLIGLVPLIVNQLTSLLHNLPDMIRRLQQFIEPFYVQFQDRFHLPSLDGLISTSAGNAGSGVQLITGALSSVLLQGLALANLLSLLFITPVVAFYLLRDWDHFTGKVDQLLPRKHAQTIRALIQEINELLAGFARGQASVCAILALFYGVGYLSVGVPFGFAIGIIAGLLSFIPYVGSAIGIILAILASLLSDHIWLTIGLAIGIFITGQVMEGNFLTPKLVGDRVRLHPVWVIFALLAFGSLFGFVGLLLAVPAAAVIGALVRFAIRQYQESRLYLGGS